MTNDKPNISWRSSLSRNQDYDVTDTQYQKNIKMGEILGVIFITKK